MRRIDQRSAGRRVRIGFRNHLYNRALAGMRGVDVDVEDRRQRLDWLLARRDERHGDRRKVKHHGDSQGAAKLNRLSPRVHYLSASGSATRPTSGMPLARITASTCTTEPYGTPASARR